MVVSDVLNILGKALNINKKIIYHKKIIDQSGYAPITRKYINTGMTIKELCKAAISYSDNGAMNILMKKMVVPLRLQNLLDL